MNDVQVVWNYPTRMLVGAGAAKSLVPKLCEELSIQSPLVVTDPGLMALPAMQNLLESWRQTGLRMGVFADVKGNPTGENVDAGARQCRENHHDGVIALGGGSAMDAAKAIALIAGQHRPLWDFEDEGDNWTRANTEAMLPAIALPTTAGTGSEVGRASVITNVQAQRKVIIFHPDMLPERVVLDADLTLGLPATLTAATGMDALSHNLEAFCAVAYHPMAEGIALEGMRLIHRYLPQVCRDGSDREARQQMLVASAMGATAFQRGLGAMHALSHTLGALYDAHHGLLNAIVMPYVLQANRPVIGARMERLARYLDLPDTGFDGVLDWILALRREIGIPHTLAEIGIDTADASRVAGMALKDPAAGGNPIALGREDYEALFVRAVQGSGC